jgi:hypothetical protein
MINYIQLKIFVIDSLIFVKLSPQRWHPAASSPTRRLKLFLARQQNSVTLNKGYTVYETF